MALDPVLKTLHRTTGFLAGGAAFDPRGTFPVRKPNPLETDEDDPPRHARIKADETQDLRFLRRHLKTELGQPLRQYFEEPLGIVRKAEGAEEIVGVPAQQRLPAAAGPDPTFEPEVQNNPTLPVRHAFPVRAAYSRRVLRPVAGFPNRRLRCPIRHLLGIRPSPAFLDPQCSTHPPERTPCQGSSPVRVPARSVSSSHLVQEIWGASRVLPGLSSCLPRPEGSGVPPHPSHSGCFVLPSRTLKRSVSAIS